MFAPNGYGLFGVCGGVQEWTADWYDAEYYARASLAIPRARPRDARRSSAAARGPTAKTP